MDTHLGYPTGLAWALYHDDRGERDLAAGDLARLGFTLEQARRLLFARWLAQTGRLSDR